MQVSIRTSKYDRRAGGLLFILLLNVSLDMVYGLNLNLMMTVDRDD